MNAESNLNAVSEKAKVAESKEGGGAPASDESLDAARHNRSYNPVDQAKRSSVSSELNEDAARYRKCPGPV